MRSILSTAQRTAIESEAKADAVLFVGEFGEPLDPSKTDWDSAAWEMGDVKKTLESYAKDAGWDLYQRELVAETERLARALS